MPVEKFVLDRFEEVADLYEAWLCLEELEKVDEVADLYESGLCLEELERVDEFSATRYEDTFVVLY